MLLYIDYLDHITSGSLSFKLLALRLRFDLLIFGRKDDTLCMSVPACVKVEDTTKLLMQLTPFWKHKKIVLQLDKKHKEKAANYFNNRKRVLARGMPEEQLIKHFEFIAYESNRTPMFFNTYLPQIAAVSPASLYIGKEKDTDALFRSETIDIFDRHYDSVSQVLGADRSICFTGITNRISSFALDKSTLFQRAIVEDGIIEEFHPFSEEQLITATLLDRSFALANAKTSNAVPLSLILNQLTGRWLIQFLSKSYKNLYLLICGMNWDDVYWLSQDSEWQELIDYINSFISVVQESVLLSTDFSIDNCIKKLSHYISLYSLLRTAKNEAINAARSKLFEFGINTYTQGFEKAVCITGDLYAGKYLSFIDSLMALDSVATQLEEKIKRFKRYSYLRKTGIKQKAKDYDLFL